MTFRSPNRIVELEGINYVKGVVQAHNSIYQEISLENDQGNDAFIEFVINNEATNSCVFIQVKSGKSYKDGNGYKIPTDKKHLQYWKRGIYLMIGIVYDPDLKKAFWINLSEYILKHPTAIDSDYHTIHVSTENEFSDAAFKSFIDHFMGLIQQYKTSENYGRSLEVFAKVNDPDLCNEGLKSLYSNFRDKPATWFSIISNFGSIGDEMIQRNILGLISNYANNPHIFWHEDNMKYYSPEGLKDHIRKLVSAYFEEREFKIAFKYMRHGVIRGDYSFLVFLVIDMVKEGHEILKKISFEENMDSEVRNHWFWLYMHSAQYRSPQDLLATIDNYFNTFPDCQNDEVIQGMRENIQVGEIIPIG
jgi:hypothetical protein